MNKLKDHYRSQKMQAVVELVKKIKGNDVNVLIIGETGSGKELVARAIHDNSPRRDKPLVTINCASIPEHLIESELFGYEKGAFTGAYDKKIGKFELADRGSVFLDEVGNLPLPAQAKVLRLVENKEFMRLGGSETIKVDVRIIAATNQPLEKRVKEKRFRRDLYFRLAVFPIKVPPLRERKEDIPDLVDEFLDICRQNTGKNVYKVLPEVMRAFKVCRWPGNVRELENEITRAVIEAKGDTIGLKELDPKFTPQPRRRYWTNKFDRSQKKIIETALEKCGGNINKAARILEMHRATLYRKIKKFGEL